MASAICSSGRELALRLTISPIESRYHFEQGMVLADPEIGYKPKPDHKSVIDLTP